ncbi:ubiquitin carboxyl-terminal hydrolase [Loa loa]|uniref:Ubiquitin carboxyl-terminal hydrolase 7 n=1 Tax=Loa loa TaxID=7209 RepID=A0A1S0UHW6_LOALO|nr:ubiquitin carboxyl-terminal hydrolase [Loa loa]EJD75026.1 ubiquitin carboxyl-terminal hydrolase [Loa loa]
MDTSECLLQWDYSERKGVEWPYSSKCNRELCGVHSGLEEVVVLEEGEWASALSSGQFYCVRQLVMTNDLGSGERGREMKNSDTDDDVDSGVPFAEEHENKENARGRVTFVKAATQRNNQEDAMDTADVNEGHGSPLSGDCEEDDPYKPEGILRMDIDRFSDFARGSSETHQKLSEPIFVRGLPWRILAMPREQNRFQSERRSAGRAFGFFLQCNGEAEAISWSCTASAVLTVLSQKPGVENHVRRINHTFYQKENDWGYSQFLPCETLLNPESGYIKDDTIKLEVLVMADAPHGVQWDSKKHAGFIGLKNQGATCYMNSILQTFFFTNQLRKAVYQMPTENDDPETSVALAMQRVFYELQNSDKPVGTKKLTKSFGWDSVESFHQHDVQELCRVLLDNLENKMSGTKVKNTIPSLFEGKMKSYVRCKNVCFESNRVESFYDLQLNIKGKANVLESFSDYTAAEILDGDNKYDAGEFGLQPAVKGVKFISFPPILHLQLMRFQYDALQDANVKINDRRWRQKEPQDFLLHAVLVHSGDFHGGHYVVFINTNLGGPPKWCKFDDDVVSRASVRDAIEANYGGDDPDLPGKSFTNAYMLVYIKKSSINDVLCPVTEEDIPRHLRLRFEEEKSADAKKKKEKLEAHLFTELIVILEEHMYSYSGFDLFDPKILDEARRLKVEKKMTIDQLYTLFAEEFHLSENNFRLWQVHENTIRDERNNALSLNRLRPSTLLKRDNERPHSNRVDMVLEGDRNIVFLETAQDSGTSLNGLPPYNETNDMMFFLKYYDADEKMTFFCGHIMINYKSMIRNYLPQILQKARLPPGTELKFYEEIAPERMRPLCIDDMISQDHALVDLVDGALLVFERTDKSTTENNAHLYYTTKYNAMQIEALQNPEGFGTPLSEQFDPILGEISQTWTMGQLMQWIASGIGCSADHILLWKVSQYNEKPTNNHLNEHELRVYSVKDLLGLTGPHRHDPRRQKRYRVYYTKMPISVSDLERRYKMRVQMMDEKMQITETTVFPEKTGTVQSILDEAQREFRFSANGTKLLRLVYVGQASHCLRAYHVFTNDTLASEIYTKIGNTSYAVSLPSHSVRVEEIPEDEVTIRPGEHLLPVGHFDKDPTRMFGIPFFIKVTNGETLESVSERIRKKLDVTVKEFEKYKFAIIVNNRVSKYLDKDNVVNLNELSHTHITGYASAPWLGLDHMNKSRGTRGSHTTEKAIVIHN